MGEDREGRIEGRVEGKEGRGKGDLSVIYEGGEREEKMIVPSV